MRGDLLDLDSGSIWTLARSGLWLDPDSGSIWVLRESRPAYPAVGAL
jgi:hypothetical protein